MTTVTTNPTANYGTKKLTLDGYIISDDFFGQPYIDQDEIKSEPSAHRFVHGGFSDTDTRFAFYFPIVDSYQGRMFQPLEGGNGGHEVSFGGGMLGMMFQRIAFAEHMGGYMVESNQGHIGDNIDEKAGNDPGLYGWRASAESARLSKFIAAQIYGYPPNYSYVWGGSGGGRRSPLCIENAPDVWQGCLPSTSGGEISEPGNNKQVRSGGPIGFGQMFNVQRLLGKEKIMRVVDAMAPGGTGNPFIDLSNHEREELARLYRLGFPRGNESMILEPMGQIWLWSSLADSLISDDPEYFNNFWNKPGYIGHDMPSAVNEDIVNTTAIIKRTISAKNLNEDEEFSGPEYQTMRMFAAMIGSAGEAYDMPYAVELEGIDSGYLLGTGIRINSGKAKGRQFYATGVVNNIFACDGHGEANLKRFSDVDIGDEVIVDNRNFLAFCYYARHHAIDEPQFSSLKLDNTAIYPQHPIPTMAPLMGNCYTGNYKGKLLWIHHTHDSSVWPANGLLYASAVAAYQGEEQAAENFCLRWNENAEHGPPFIVPPEPNRASNTRLIDFTPITEQSLVDLVDWVEKGIKPVASNYSYTDGKIILANTAEERRGIQPIVKVKANGKSLTHCKINEPVTLEVEGEIIAEAGKIINVKWDFDGSGSFPFSHHEIDGKSSSIHLKTSHSYAKPGIYFVSALVESHRNGDINATKFRIPNVAQAKIIVNE